MHTAKYIGIGAAVLAMLLGGGCAAPVTQRIVLDQSAVAEEAMKQQRLTLRLWRERQQRLYDISSRILEGGAPLCEKRTHSPYGISIENIFNYGEAFQAAARKEFGVDEHVRVALLASGGAAQKAGIQSGDRLLAINGQDVLSGKNAVKKTGEILQKHAASDGADHFQVLRGTQPLRVELPQLPVQCNFPVVLTTDDAINAFADGRRVIITSGMMRFAVEQQELALVVSHELAHNLMGHIDAKRMNSLGGLILDVLFAGFGINTNTAFSQLTANAHSVGFEAEADYVGLYLMARAGMELEGAENFWRRMAVENPGSIGHAQTHPTTPERYLAIDQAVQEIRAKAAQGLPLQPELKKKEKKKQQ